MQLKQQMILAIWMVFALNYVTADTYIQQECRKIFQMDVDPTNNQFLNGNCKIQCNIHGNLNYRDINEGQPCQYGSTSGYCHNGQCQNAYQGRLGHIDIAMKSASFSRQYSAYVAVCIRNNSMPVQMPIQDWNSCTACSSHVRQNTNYPVWNEVCEKSSNYLFNENSRIVLEVWDKTTTQKQFIGGYTLTIDQLLQHGDNHRELHLPLVGTTTNEYAAQLNAMITWTPRN